eukprot:TRINITY_DN3555_c1_g1_i6.p4 TRINITY_DN3555_c1_g1~~TRINITY_DN3555_c1_g1_i6.p4  ORF type:complete len:257 (-),score=-2.14 TRINITY_DN3555_c1_g1_i6:2120-2866(-)
MINISAQYSACIWLQYKCVEAELPGLAGILFGLLSFNVSQSLTLLPALLFLMNGAVIKPKGQLQKNVVKFMTTFCLTLIGMILIQYKELNLNDFRVWILGPRIINPNLGQWWYFCTEIFPDFAIFFRFVLFSIPAVICTPLLIKYSKKEGQIKFAYWIQAMMIVTVRPSQNVFDLIMPMLVVAELRIQIKYQGFWIVSYCLIIILALMMWIQWLHLDSANANFFYSMTLLLGTWQSLFMSSVLAIRND